MFNESPSRPALKIAALYVFFAGAWILFSDRAVRHFFPDPEVLTTVATLKGWFFVAVTATMVFVLVRRQIRTVGETTLAQRASDERFRSLASLSPDIISIFDREGRLTFNSAAALRIHGYRDEDLIGHSTFEMVHPDDRAAVQAGFAAMLKDPGKPAMVRYRYRNADGSYTWMEAAGRNELNNPNLRGIIAISRDVTERVRADQKLRESDARFQQVVSSMSDMLFATDLKSVLTFIGPQVSQFGYTPEEVVGRSLLELLFPEDRERVAAELSKAVATGAIVGAEFRLLARDGSLAWLQESAGFILDDHGARIGVSGMLRNITDKKRAEEEKRSMQEQLTQAQKMEAVGQLAGGVAHDFNNILTVISMQVALLKEEHSPQQVTAACNELEEAVRRASALTRQLLLFARRQVVQKRAIDLDALLGHLLIMLRRLIGEDIAVETPRAARAAWVLADAGMIEQVVMNLALNARDAMPKGGRLRISTAFEQFDAGTAGKAEHPGRRAGRFVCLEVSDTGCGMDAETQRKVFEPFFTTKEAGKGTGLGLATVFGIVQQHEGWIEIESAAGKGSTFRTFLPEAAPAAVTGRSAAAIAPGGQESILVTEDDPSVRELCQISLRRLGYQVATACNGQEAIDLWTKKGGAFDLLLTDMIMPEGLTGLDVAKLLRLEKPSLKVIVMSGYSLELSRHAPLDAGRIEYLAKPFNPQTLAQAVRRVLGQPVL